MFRFQRKRQLSQSLDLLRPDLYRVAWSWCHDNTLAEELVQEACQRAIHHPVQPNESQPLKPWLLQIMVKLHDSHLQRLRDGLRSHRHTQALNARQTTERNVTLAQVHQAVAKLQDEQRKVLTLVDIASLNYSEVGYALELPVGTVINLLSEARANLKKSLTPEHTDSQHLRRVK